MKQRSRHILLGLLTIVMAFVVGCGLWIYVHLGRSVALVEGEVTIEGPESAIEITFDRMGIPQIWAESERDGYFAMGYLHASDRMHQMDLIRRVAEGRLSEMIGERGLALDIQQRRVGHTRIAQRGLRDLSEHNRRRLQAYTDGVNAYRKHCPSLPAEYLVLPVGFDEWTIEDCLAVLSFETWFSDALMSRDEFSIELLDAVGPEKARSLCRRYPDWAPVTVPEESVSSDWHEESLPASSGSAAPGHLADGEPGPLPPVSLSPYLGTGASNAWAISPIKSSGGHAMLASDPHLELTRLPQFWYMLGVHIEEDSQKALGITVPGLPAVIMGHNGKAAWAMTAAGIDVQDHYLERLNPDDTNQYLTAQGWRDFTVINDSIPIAGVDTPFTIAIRLSHRGPVVKPGPSQDQVYSLRWAGFDTDLDRALSSAAGLLTVDSFGRFQQLATSLGALNANWIYADISGNIGYQLGTPIPIRPVGDGSFPLPGENEESEWQGYFHMHQTPHAFNPAQGWLASCNNRPSLAQDVPGVFFPERITRITELLASQSTFSLDDMKASQGDRTDAYLRRWKDEAARFLDYLGKPQPAAAMRSWDGRTGVDSRETALLMVFLSELRRLLFSDELGDRHHQVSQSALDAVYHSEDTLWIDNVGTPDQVETRDDIARKAMELSLDAVADRTWGEMQSLTMRHPMASVPVLGGLLGLKKGPWPWPGTAYTLNASFSREHLDRFFECVVGPSWRFVIDFADVDGAQFVLPAGNSGNPLSPHFFDFFELWRNHKYWNVPFRYSRVKEQATSTLVLVPPSIS